LNWKYVSGNLFSEAIIEEFRDKVVFSSVNWNNLDDISEEFLSEFNDCIDFDKIDLHKLPPSYHEDYAKSLRDNDF